MIHCYIKRVIVLRGGIKKNVKFTKKNGKKSKLGRRGVPGCFRYVLSFKKMFQVFKKFHVA